jgi:hypothetical protein
MKHNFEEHQIECPRCGEEVYYELIHCSNCGLNFYQTDEQGDWWEGEETGGGKHAPWLDVSIAALLLGWIVSGLISFGLHYLTAQIFESPSTAFMAQLVVFIASPLGAFVGGWITIAIAERRAIAHGMVIGLLSIGDAILLEAYWRDLNFENLLKTTTILGWGFTLMAALLVTHLYMKRVRLNMVEALFFPTESESRLYEELSIKVGYDPERVERLIDYERQRAPQESRAELIKRAIQRWNRDNR